MNGLDPRLWTGTLINFVELVMSKSIVGVIFTPNLDHLRRLDSDARFQATYACANYLLPDGWPVVFLARMAGISCEGRVAGSDVVQECLNRGGDYLFLGGAPGDEEELQKAIGRGYPWARVTIIGLPIVKDAQHLDISRVAALLMGTHFNAVFVCIGSPKQEELCLRLAREVPQQAYFGVGASMDFLSGRSRRAPRAIQRVGLEWLHRMLSSPRRLGPRYMQSVLFLLRLLVRPSKLSLGGGGGGYGP